MAYRPIDHIAFHVPDLRAAEAFSGVLFDATVAFREVRVDGDWRTLPADVTYDDAARVGISPMLCFLRRDDLVVALHAGEAPRPPSGPLDHVALRMNQADLDHLRGRAGVLGCRLLADRPDYLLFEDPLGVRWEVGPAGEWGPEPRSTGEITGRWAELPSKDREQR